jgi:hypothetical protein
MFVVIQMHNERVEKRKNLNFLKQKQKNINKILNPPPIITQKELE